MVNVCGLKGPQSAINDAPLSNAPKSISVNAGVQNATEMPQALRQQKLASASALVEPTLEARLFHGQLNRFFRKKSDVSFPKTTAAFSRQRIVFNQFLAAAMF